MGRCSDDAGRISTAICRHRLKRKACVVWVTNGTCDQGCIGGALIRVGLEGGTPQDVIDLEEVHATAHHPIQGIFANDSHIYFPVQDYETKDVSIYRATPTGSVLHLYTMDAPSAYSQRVQVDDAYVYLKDNGQFVRIPK